MNQANQQTRKDKARLASERQQAGEPSTGKRRRLTLEELSRVTGGVNQPHHFD